MNLYYKALSSKFAFAIILLTLLGASSCTEVDDTLGSNLVPDDQQMVFGMDTISGIDTYITYDPEAIPMSNLSNIVLGSIETTEFGKLKCGAALQFLPRNFQEANGISSDGTTIIFEDVEEWGNLGYKPVIDSVGLAFRIIQTRGDVSVPQTFRVYPLKKKLTQKEAYYINTDVDEIADVDPSKELFSFTLENDVVGAHYKRLTPTTAGQEFIDDLFEYNYTNNYSDASFLDDFYGFYIKPDESVENGAIYLITFTDATNLYTYFRIDCHNHAESTVADPNHDHGLGENLTIKDTLAISYTFDDDYQYTDPLTSILLIDHDYNGTNMSEANRVTPDESGNVTGQAKAEVFVQSLMGVNSFMKFNDDFLSYIEELKNSNGGYSTINIHNATLLINMTDPSVEKMNNAPDKLILYLKYKAKYPFSITRLSTWSAAADYQSFYDSAPKAVRDYDYLGIYSDTYFGGSLNRNFGWYEMDITQTFRDIVNGRTSQNYMWIAPEPYLASMVWPYEVSLRGTADASATEQEKKLQPRVAVTYTLIK